MSHLKTSESSLSPITATCSRAIVILVRNLTLITAFIITTMHGYNHDIISIIIYIIIIIFIIINSSINIIIIITSSSPSLLSSSSTTTPTSLSSLKSTSSYLSSVSPSLLKYRGLQLIEKPKVEACLHTWLYQYQYHHLVSMKRDLDFVRTTVSRHGQMWQDIRGTI